MNKTSWTILIVLVLVLIGVGIAFAVQLYQPETANEITVTFRADGGFRQRVTEVVLSKYHKGARAEVTYHIINETGRAITPSIQTIYAVKPEDYSKIEGEGYVAVPSYYSDWLDKPTTAVLEPGADVRYTLVLEIPDDTIEPIPPKWVFQTTVSSGVGGFAQYAPGAWWVVNMR